MVRRTVAASVSRGGRGIHSGEPCRVTLRPAAFGTGWILETADGTTPVDWRSATAGEGCTRIGPVGTPEHLLAALSGLGVSDVVIAVDGPEVPALDGSAREWVAALDEIGIAGGPPLTRRPLPAVEVHAASGHAAAGPGPDRIAVAVDFGPGGPVGSLDLDRDETTFREGVAWARTFVLASQVSALRRAGRGRGATPENTVVWPGAPLRAPDEPVRHKLLDAWGDLALLGPTTGWIRIERGSHALHHALIRRIVEAWGA